MCKGKDECFSCAGINGSTMAKRKRRRRTAEVDVQDLLMKTAIGVLGFGVSNVVTAQVASITGSTNTLPYSGAVKLIAGAATAFAGNKYGGSLKNEISAAALGMALSGGLDLSKEFLPDSVKTAIGINAPVYLGNGSTMINQRLAAAAAGAAGTRSTRISLRTAA